MKSDPAKWVRDFDLRLLSWFDRTGEASNPLHHAVRYALESPGKRLRPLFVHESSTLMGFDSRAAEFVSFAIECIHTFSLVHDDLPALDNDDFRRGLPTVHKKFGEALAILAGDELLNLGHAAFLEVAPLVNYENFIRAHRYFAASIGVRGMNGGQAKEVATTPEDLNALIEIQSRKTGALFRASIVIPALLTGSVADGKQIQDLTQYADAFGFAFQIADDLEDEEQDRAESKKNILSLMGRQEAIRLARERLELAPYSNRFSTTELLLSKLS